MDNFNVQETGVSRRVQERRLAARDTRVKAAQVAAERKHADQFNNNDEVNYPATPLAGNYSKSLRHDDLGDPDPASYATLLRALESRDPSDFEEIILGPAGMPKKLTNPQAGFAFDIEGPDAQEFTIPPAPRFDSVVTAHEMGELYWMATARDVPFIQYSSNAIIADSVASLNTEFPQFGGTVPVTAGTSTTVGNVFRGIYPGEQVGPYVSQFLLKGNVDQRKPAGQGRNAVDGFISYGARTIDQRLFNATPGKNYLFEDFETWLNAQDGQDFRGDDTFETTKRFIHTLRAGATLVHFDQVVDAYWNAAWILMSEPTGNQSTFVDGTTGRPQIDSEFPYNRGNPYMPPTGITPSRTQVGFATFGPTHLLQAVPEVLGRALRAVWWQKWGVHRRLRPEEYGGRVDNMINDRRSYPIDPSIITSLETGGLGEYYPNGTYLLPQAYPEGAPTHPAYGAGHATGSGAMITILKAFFDDLKEIENPVQASVDGLTLVPYTRPQTEPVMTVGGELNKLAGNIAIFRNAAGVHWRSDYTESLLLGEKVAIALLQEMTLGFNEDDAFFELTRLDGIRIRIFDGEVVPAL
ncbi:vanadium-dependent haloperoxidase [Longimicrobium terrae]|nr:vanadium-dependent haloperoxidase [Longimicrobium terrae]